MSEPRYWHFARAKKMYPSEIYVPHLAYGDNRPIVLNQTLRVNGAPILCEYGLHASYRAYNALQNVLYRTRPLQLTRVTLGGVMQKNEEKVAAQERTVIAMLTIEQTFSLLRDFAFWCALQVAHLYDMPEEVRAYLEQKEGANHEVAKQLALQQEDAHRTYSSSEYCATRAAYLAVWHIEVDAELVDDITCRAIQALVYKELEDKGIAPHANLPFERQLETRHGTIFTAEFERRCLAAVGETPDE